MEEEKTKEARRDKETSAFFGKRERLSYGRTGYGQQGSIPQKSREDTQINRVMPEETGTCPRHAQQVQALEDYLYHSLTM